MYDNDSKGISYGAAFFMLIAFAVAGLFFAAMINASIWQQMTGTGFDTMEKGMGDPANANVMKIIQATTAIVGFFIPTLVTAFFINKKPLKLIGFSGPGVKVSQIGLVILIILASLFISSSLSYITRLVPLPENLKISFDKMEMEYNQQVSAIISLKNTKDYIVALVLMAFLPALCEEVLFRGGLQNFLSRSISNAWLSIVIVSFLFSIAHNSYYGFLSRFFLGFVLGALFHYSGKLWLSILGHFIYNGIAITMLYVGMQQGKELKDIMGDNTGNIWGIIAIPAVLGLFFILQKTISASANRRVA